MGDKPRLIWEVWNTLQPSGVLEKFQVSKIFREQLYSHVLLGNTEYLK